MKEQIQKRKQPPAATQRVARALPPDQTHAESFYYVKQMQNHTPMVVVMRDGEVLRGTVEWYDRYCLKLHRDGAPNLLVYKIHIKYVYKDEDAPDAEPEAGPNGSAAKRPK